VISPLNVTCQFCQLSISFMFTRQKQGLQDLTSVH
jgi:hypothetical protein